MCIFSTENEAEKKLRRRNKINSSLISLIYVSLIVTKWNSTVFLLISSHSLLGWEVKY